MAIPSHMTIFNQSECFISAYHSYATLKFVHDIGSWKDVRIVGLVFRAKNESGIEQRKKISKLCNVLRQKEFCWIGPKILSEKNNQLKPKRQMIKNIWHKKRSLPFHTKNGTLKAKTMGRQFLKNQLSVC